MKLMIKKTILEVPVLHNIDMKSPKDINKAILICLKVDQEV